MAANTSKGHVTDSDIETIDEIQPNEQELERKDTPPPAWSSLFSQSPPLQEAEEGRESMNTIISDGIPVVEDCLSPDGSNYIWSREEGIHSEDEGSDDTDEPFSTIIKTSPKQSIDTLSSELTTSTYLETELPEEFNFFDAITNGGSPTRDISWHPHLPLIASTSFRGHIDLYTLQNFDQTELE